ncbi:hypothetical protein CROQUDRAFT_682715 [Cronartium quercuum f. sp. fusiforme G11]|uniref:Thiamine pyrophosphokinase n=1 Tax=Cronartium quercuum f. sp. fusiforme G11 TaxID=708437 RepID=A0A9P6NQC2_9BASI|nr:hypothetical protein CROQUDRAFT_682715 [Cronartium quercuum f. sp. fusiforme G11]
MVWMKLTVLCAPMLHACVQILQYARPPSEMTFKNFVRMSNGSSIQKPAKNWSTPNLLSPTEEKRRTCLIILNTSISTLQPERFHNLWTSADLRICADGGANRLHDFDPELELRPDYIKGDLDSLRPSVRELYSSSTCIIHDPSQNSTDLGKCIELVEEIERSEGQTYQIVIHGGLNGRLDQTLHTLHTLLILESGQQGQIVEGYRHQTSRRHLGETWVVDTHSGSMACALEPSYVHRFSIPAEWERDSNLTCGLLPLGVDSALVTTRGLRWDLDNTRTSMTGLLSTSNQVATDTTLVEIETDRAIIWTMELPSARR